jgi:hypothetical protein
LQPKRAIVPQCNKKGISKRSFSARQEPRLRAEDAQRALANQIEPGHARGCRLTSRCWQVGGSPPTASLSSDAAIHHWMISGSPSRSLVKFCRRRNENGLLGVCIFPRGALHARISSWRIRKEACCAGAGDCSSLSWFLPPQQYPSAVRTILPFLLAWPHRPRPEEAPRKFQERGLPNETKTSMSVNLADRPRDMAVWQPPLRTVAVNW